MELRGLRIISKEARSLAISHMLGCLLRVLTRGPRLVKAKSQAPRIITISWVSCERSDPKQRASSASADSAANDMILTTAHHQHQLGQPRNDPIFKHRAFSASAGSATNDLIPSSAHHQHHPAGDVELRPKNLQHQASQLFAI